MTLLLSAAVFLLATNLMSGLLYVLDALLLSLLVVGAVTSVQSVAGLRVERAPLPRAAEGEDLTSQLSLLPRRGVRLLIVEDGWSGTRGRTLVAHAPVGVSTTAAVTLHATRRGRNPMDPVMVISRGLLGLFTWRRQIAPSGQYAVIWPQTRPVTPLALQRLLPALDGSAGGQRVREAADFYGVRDYQPGDLPSRIHWRSSARRGLLVVREFERPRAPATAIVVDLDRRQTRARLDAAARAAASIFEVARGRGLGPSVLGWAAALEEHWNPEAAKDWLAGVEPSGPPLATVLHGLGVGRPLVVVASTGQVPPLPETAVLVVPAAEAHAAPGSGELLVYDEDGSVRLW